MLSFLFWNLMGIGQPERFETLGCHLAQIASGLDVDLFLFAEPFCDGAEMERILSRGQTRRYRDMPSATDRLQILTRLPRPGLVTLFDSVDGRLTVRRIRVAASETLLAVAHFPSQLHRTADDLAFYAKARCDEIVQAEEDAGHRRTLVVGDFNMDPFDRGLVEADALHAVMTRQIARAGARQVFGKAHRFFYNPMWGLFGDRTAGPPGSYYRSPDSSVAYHWHMFDQVLLRPTLMDNLLELRILDTDGEKSLLTADGHPRRSVASDHLPILFRLDIAARGKRP